MTLANKITLLRIALIPVFLIGILHEEPIWPTAIFIISAFSDLLDGAVARIRGEKTVLGSFLDPVADKLLLDSTYLIFAHLRIIPMWVFVIVLSRDVMILVGWNIIAILTQSSSLFPRWLGKTTTFLEMITAILLLTAPNSPIRPFFLWATIAVTSASMLDSIWVGAKQLSRLDAGPSFAE